MKKTGTEEMITTHMAAIREWALAGVAEKEMAEMLGIAYSTFREQKKSNALLEATLAECGRKRKVILKSDVEQVEASLFKRCMGYNAEVKKNYKVKRPATDKDGSVLVDDKGRPIMVEGLEEKTEETHVPADIGAIKFFLLNNARQKWKNDPDRLEIDKKRLANDSKRTKLAIDAASVDTDGKTIEDILKAAEGKEGQ